MDLLTFTILEVCNLLAFIISGRFVFVLSEIPENRLVNYYSS